MKNKLFIFLTLFFLLWIPLITAADDNPNIINFENKSGSDALVKLVGPTTQAVDVPNNETRSTHVAAGEYYILVRYGSTQQKYQYSKGNPFTVTQTETQYSVITITLHTVVGGNYNIHSSSKGEFDKISAPKDQEESSS